MTQEEKAKAYDEALERARKIHNETEFDYEKGMMEEIFPELKESEDEKIKKELIDAVQGLWDNDALPMPLSAKRKDAWIAWLEKQGELRSIWHNEDEEPKRGSLILLIMQSGTPIVAKIIEPNHTFNHGERWAYIDDLLEKQGKNPQGKSALEDINEEKIDKQNCIKPADFKAEHFYVSKVDGQIHDMTYNPTDKVEPKFRNRQWIVWQDKCYKVNYNGCGYELIDQNGLSTSLEYKTVDESAHLWDIVQDAKDGDVLCVKYGNDEMPFIFTGKQDNVAYCALNSFNEFVLSLAEWLLKISVLPATKEQRDLLFQKMKEAGYEWDAEKKKLKKVEQKPDSAWSEEDGNKVEEIIEYLNELFDNYRLDLQEINDYENWLKSLKQRIKE